MPLTGSQRRFLRSLGHHLNPIVQVGHQGSTETVVQALAQALEDHELVKIKFNQTVEDRSVALEGLAKGTGSECVQTLGRTALMYLRHPKKPKIEMPAPHKAKKLKIEVPAPRTAKKPKIEVPAPRKAKK